MKKWEWTKPSDYFYLFPTHCYSDYLVSAKTYVRYFSWLWFHWSISYDETTEYEN